MADTETKLALVRQDGDVEIVAPVHEIVADTYAIIQREIRLLRKIQLSGSPLTMEDTMRLQRLMNALAKAHRAQLDALDSEDLGKLDRKALLAELRKELDAG